MAFNQLYKITWLVDTIIKAGKITFSDLNDKWKQTEMSGGLELSKRTFHKWKDAVLDIFGLIIENECVGDYAYYIENANEFKSGSIKKWLFNTYAISNILADSKQIKDRIILEDVPSGRVFLDNILQAMKESWIIKITYTSFHSREGKVHTVEPYCIKIFRQRWYLLARPLNKQQVFIYAIDRIKDIEVSNQGKFEFPKDFSAKQYFDGCFGIINDAFIDVETIRLKVDAYQANYLREIPLHESQREVETSPTFSIFEVKVKPTFDFIQEVLSHGEYMEVLSPFKVRSQIKCIVEKMSEFYKMY